MKKFFATALLLLTMVLTGCGGSDSAGGSDEMNVMLNSNVVSLDSAQCTDLASFEMIANCIDGLMQPNADGKPVPALAEKIDVSADGKTYIFHLRDAKWSNGDPVTAEDFVFAWRRHCQKAGEYAYVFGSTVACVKNADAVIKGADPKTLGVTAKNAKTLVVELDAPVPFFLSLMAFPTFYPINEKFYASVDEGNYGTSPETFLSNGAFMLTSYVPGAASIRLKKNDSYWDAAKVSLAGFGYQVVTSSDNALISFKNGTLQLVNLGGNQAEHAKQDAELSQNLRTFSSGTLTYLSFNQDAKNHHAGALSNVNLRLAITNAIDRESLVNNFVTAGTKATYTAVPVDFAPNAETGKFFSEDQKRFADVVSFDVSKAKKYLELAKRELGKDSFELELIFSNDSGDMAVKVVQAIKSQVEENLPGVTVKLQPMPKAEYLSNVTSDSYDMALVDWAPDYDDPMTFLTLWTTEGCSIAEHWSNAEYDRIINDCTTGSLAADYEARWQALYEAEKILLDNAVIAPLFTDANAVLISPKVTGVEFHTSGVSRVYKNVKVK